MTAITSRSPHRAEARTFGLCPPHHDYFAPLQKKFVFYFFFVGLDCFSFGFHISFLAPNIELHIPFGFIRLGWQLR